MKKLLLTSALLLFVLFQGNAQRFDYENTSKAFFGLNIGSVWHTSDVENVKNRFPLGVGFVFGGSINQNYENAVSFDLRFRYLGGAWYGQDSDTTSAIQNNYAVNALYDTLGYTVQNFRAAQHRFALELSMHANRLKERTGIDPYIFGGIGFTATSTKGDLLQNVSASNDGSIYPYNENTNGSIIDKKYETHLDMNEDGEPYSTDQFDMRVLPSLGVGIGYYFNSRFSMGIEHKTTFFLGDYFDGTTVTQEGQPSKLFENDLYHYTSIYFKWYLRSNKNKWDPIEENTPPVKPHSPETNPVRNDKPIVDFTNPSNSPHRANSPKFTLRANVRNVSSADGITFTGNQQRNTNFTFNPTKQAFMANVQLVPGLNTFFLKGENQFGKSRDVVEIYYEREERGNPPVVKITNPTLVPHYTNQLSYSVEADIRNVDSRNNIKVWLNDQIVTHFDFNTSGNNNFLIHLNLKAATNTLRIEGRNQFGQDTDEAIIIYKRDNIVDTGYAPIVNILTPNTNPYTTNQQTENIVAKVENVNSKQSIEVRINGVKKNNFSFNNSNGRVQFNAGLNVGVNIVRISASNTFGSDFDETQVIYRRGGTGTAGYPPLVNIFTPNISPYTTDQPYENILAKIENVDRKQNVEVRINGVQTNNFAFNSVSNSTLFQVQLNAVLTMGINTIQISANNAHGSDFDETQIIYKREVNNPVYPPVVNILTPNADPYTTAQASKTVISKVDNITSKSQVQVQINGTQTNNFTFNSGTNRVQLNAGLNMGVNTVRVTANNAYGSDFDQTQIIYRRVQTTTGLPPVVKILTPNVNPYSTNQLSENITAKVDNVNTKQQIEVRINGALTNNFTFNSGNNRVQFSAGLNAGTNTIRINASNTYGNDADESTIHYKRKPTAQPPTVEFLAPLAGQAAVTPSSYVMIAKVEHVTNKSDLQVTLNGNIINSADYSFNPQIKMLTYTSTLRVGVNNFIVSANNSDGTDQATSNIERKKRVIGEADVNLEDAEVLPCEDPEMRISSPRNIETKVDNNGYNIRAHFENLNKTSKIKITINGKTVDGYTFNQGNKLFMHKAQFEQGRNTYTIHLTNECGTTEESFIFINESAPGCGVKIDMVNVNSDFCLITSTGTVTSHDLIADPNFSYDGQASSLYFKATAHGKATVNGVDYNLVNGNYYHFIGVITVDVSKNRAGANGQWSVCVSSVRPPQFGKGSKKPNNPCAKPPNTKPDVKPKPNVREEPNVRGKPNTRGKPDIREKPSINREGSGGDPERRETPSKTEERKTPTPRNTGRRG